MEHMKQIKESVTINVHFRIIMIYLSSVLLLSVTSISLYFVGINIVQTQNLGNVKLEVSNCLKNLESDILRVRILRAELIEDTDVKMFALNRDSLPSAKKLSVTTAIQKRLDSAKISNQYIEDIFLSIMSSQEDILFSTKKDGSKYKAIEQDMRKIISIMSSNEVIYYEGKMFLVETYPAYSSSKAPKYMVAIEISQDAIRNHLISMLNSEGDGVLAFNTSRNIIIANESKALKTNNLDFILSNYTENKSYGVIKKIEGHTFIITYEYSKDLDMTIVKYIPTEKYMKPLKGYNFLLFLFVFFGLIASILFYFVSSRLIHIPLKKLIEAFKKVEAGNFDACISDFRNDEFSYIFQSYNQMLSKLKMMIEKVYQMNLLAKSAELKQLQAQINPHFLYNSFYIQYRMMEMEDYETLKVFTKYLGKYFEYLHHSGEEEVPLKQEVDHAKNYASIQGLRFKKRISIEFQELDENFGNIFVPRLILQPIIENAFEHSLENKFANGLLKVLFKYAANVISIVIEDNGTNIEYDEVKKIQALLENSEYNHMASGIVNIHHRIRLKFKQGSGLQIQKSELGGLKVIVIIIF